MMGIGRVKCTMMKREEGEAEQVRQRQIKSLALTSHTGVSCIVTQGTSDGK